MGKISKIHARLLGRKHTGTSASVIVTPRTLPEPIPEPSAATVDGKPKKQVIFMSRDMVSRYNFDPTDVLISISDTDATTPYLDVQPREVLSLAFHDHVTRADIAAFGWRQMSCEDGAKIAAFVTKFIDTPNIIVHCNYGQSRSKAAALAIGEIDDRIVLHINDRGYTRKYNRRDGTFYNRRVYELIRIEFERSLIDSA
jgi:predicted protein tyrosine phosphatase